MRESLRIGPSPYGEDCAQIGAGAGYDYRTRAMRECAVFIRQLRRHAEANGVDLNDAGVDLGMKGAPHDIANDSVTYYEVFAYFEDGDERAIEAAYWLECSVPELWDEIARGELGLGVSVAS